MVLLFIIAIAFVHCVKEGLEENFYLTRFANKNPNFFNPQRSRLVAKKVLGIRYDAETIATAIMILLIMLAFALSNVPFFSLPFGIFINGFIYIVVYIAAFNLSGKLYLFKKPTS